MRRLRTVSRGGSSRALQWWGLGMGGTLSWTLTTTVGAMLLVVAVMIDPAARHDLVLRMVCVGLVIASWGALVTAQALAYARADAQHGGIDFEGSPEPVFGDYLSLAVFISAMFGTGDARCSGTRLRSTIRAHVLVAFGFNSMVVAHPGHAPAHGLSRGARPHGVPGLSPQWTPCGSPAATGPRTAGSSRRGPPGAARPSGCP